MQDEKQEKKEEQQPAENLKEKLENAEKERDEYLNGWRRAKADLINYQKDEAKRFEEMVNYSKEMVIGDVIPVLDSLELAIAAKSPVRGSEGSQLSASNGNDVGLAAIKAQLEDTFKKYSLEKIKVSPGDAFDTSLHESIGEIESKEAESGKIAAEVSSGYKLKNKVIRPARVKLSK